MKRFISGLMTFILLISQNGYSSDNSPKEEAEKTTFEKGRIKSPYSYMPNSQYQYIGDDKERDVAIFSKKNDTSFFQRLGKVLWGNNNSQK